MNLIAEQIICQVNLFVHEQSANINWNHQPEIGKWSVKEILGHLVDSALVNLQRFVRGTYETEFDLFYNQDQWVIAQNYKDADINQLLEHWRLINAQIATVLNNYPNDCWQATCNNHTIEFLASDYLHHMLHHLNQIIQLNKSV